MDIQAPRLDGPITRSKAKKLQGKLASFITHLNLISTTLRRSEEVGHCMAMLTLVTPMTALDPAHDSAVCSP